MKKLFYSFSLATSIIFGAGKRQSAQFSMNAKDFMNMGFDAVGWAGFCAGVKIGVLEYEAFKAVYSSLTNQQITLADFRNPENLNQEVIGALISGRFDRFESMNIGDWRKYLTCVGPSRNEFALNALAGASSWLVKNKMRPIMHDVVQRAPASMEKYSPALTKKDIVDLATEAVEASTQSIIAYRGIKPRALCSSMTKRIVSRYICNKIEQGASSFNEKLHIMDPNSRKYKIVRSLGKNGLELATWYLVSGVVNKFMPNQPQQGDNDEARIDDLRVAYDQGQVA